MFENLKNKITIINENPLIGYVDNFLSNEECKYIIHSSLKNFKRATVVDEKGGEGIIHDGRTNSNTWLDYNKDPMIKAIGKKVSRFVEIPLSHAENLGILEYKVGEYYRPHYDGFDLSSPGGEKHCKHGHQRILTTILYLNTPDAGGNTSFPNIEKSIDAITGRLAVFVNVNDDMITRPVETFHGGDTVLEGVKYAATMWFHIRPRTEIFKFPCEPPSLDL